MSEPPAAGSSPGPGQAGAGSLAVAAVVVLSTLAAVAAGGGVLLALAPAALAGAAWVTLRLPLRWPVALLLLGLLALEDTSETTGQWRSPLALAGDLLHGRLDAVTGVPGLAVTGMEVLVVLLLAVWSHRRAAGRTTDTAGLVPAPAVMRGLVLVYLAAVAFALLHGVLRGQPVVPWKVRNLVHPLLLYLLFHLAFRGPADHPLLGRVVVAAAVLRALQALVVQRLSVAETGGKFATATSHGDSVLFAVAAFLLVIDLLERPAVRRLVRGGLLLPVILVGMLENGRRLAWVMLGMLLAVAVLVGPARAWKRAFAKGVLVAAPLLALYVAAGWNREGRAFAPVRTLRSVTDTSADHSAYWREVENWNIAVSLRERPLLGQGLGGRYVEHMQNDDISGLYREYLEWPHNTVLGQLLLLGLLGFTAAWSIFTAGLFLAFRSYWWAASPELRTAALGCLGALVACHLLAWADTGAHYPQYKVFVALALAMAGKLAIVTGAWPARQVAAPARGPAAPGGS